MKKKKLFSFCTFTSLKQSTATGMVSLHFFKKMNDFLKNVFSEGFSLCVRAY